MSEPSSGWGRIFHEPIELPDGRKLILLRDAASYITALPKKKADGPEWQAAIEALMLVAQLGGPTMCPDRRDAGIEPRPRSRVQSVAEAASSAAASRRD
jgi:hypothetical protein